VCVVWIKRLSELKYKTMIMVPKTMLSFLPPSLLSSHLDVLLHDCDGECDGNGIDGRDPAGDEELDLGEGRFEEVDRSSLVFGGCNRGYVSGRIGGKREGDVHARWMLPNFFWCLPALRASSWRGCAEGSITREFWGCGPVRGGYSDECNVRLTSLYHPRTPDEASSSGGASNPRTEMQALTRSRTEAEGDVSTIQDRREKDARRFCTMFIMAEHPQPLPKRMMFLAEEIL
jgi:hypothetical protein